MAPLPLTLALLAMAVATVAMEVVNLDTARNSFDDQYLNCGVDMSNKFPELQRSDFLKNSHFANAWKEATVEWEERGSVSSHLTRNESIALMAYSMKHTKLYKEFNEAVREAGSSSRKYQNEFHFKSLHFLLTRALQRLRTNDCLHVFRGMKGVKFNATVRSKVRLSQFTSSSWDQEVAQRYGKDTMFKIYTCHGAAIHKFAYCESEKEVLIPPFETFEVTKVNQEGNLIELRYTGTFSNYNCEWLTGGSIPRNSPNLWGLLLVTMAMAAVSRTL